MTRCGRYPFHYKHSLEEPVQKHPIRSAIPPKRASYFFVYVRGSKVYAR